MRVDATEAVEELRALAHGIYPPILHARGVVAALRSWATTAPIPIRVKDEGVERSEEATESAIYFCALEAIQNTIKHAGPGAQVSIRLYTAADRLHLEVRDKGCGFDVNAAHDGTGLQNMRDRLGAVRGSVEIYSDPRHGTLVAATVPRSHPSAASPATGSGDGRSTLGQTPASVRVS
jgi:signal transduction histidine kinase